MTPDLITVIWVEGLDKARAQEIAAASEQRDGFRVHAQREGFRGPWRLLLPDVHAILTDEADWDAVTWAMDPAGLERLAQTLAWLYAQLSGEFTFEAVWGEEPIDKLTSRDELLRIVRAGQIGTRARYRLPAAPLDGPTSPSGA